MPSKIGTTLSNVERPTKWKKWAITLPGDSVTFSRQSELPRLPIPSLAATLERLRNSLKPLAHSSEEWNITERKINEFASSAGPQLHAKLEERAQRHEVDHWLEEFWDDTAYLKYRAPVMVNVSYYWGFSHQPAHLPQGPAARAACLTRGALLFRKMIIEGTLPPETLKNQPLCMDSYRWMFDCCRVPGLNGEDWSVTYANKYKTGNSGHVIALRNGRVWKINVAGPEDGELLTTAQLETQYQVIYESIAAGNPPVGVLTSSDRDTWAKNYALLASDTHNASIIHALQSSAFVVCLDSSNPSSVYEVSRGLFHGGLKGEQLGNRWYDKPCEFIIFDNGQSGFLGEHSMMDGTSTSALGHWILHSLQQPNRFDHGGEYPAREDDALDRTVLSPPQPLDWVITSSIVKSINSAIHAAGVMIDQQDMGLLTVDYGRSEIKNFGVSPDAWTQMVIQLAYHRMCDQGGIRNGGTYESAMTRKFLKGRTEAIRVVTHQSMTWCDSMDDITKSNRDRIGLLNDAARAHGILANSAINAQGIDRHLLGLKKMVQDGESLPELFSDPLYTRGNHWVLSTSAVFSPYFTRGYGWGQVVDDGFGVAYMTGFTDRLEFTVTSLRSQPNAKFVQELDKAAHDMKHLFLSNSDKA